jgi:phosphoglycolate phosphatase-like HAD superfamily hydrolase
VALVFDLDGTLEPRAAQSKQSGGLFVRALACELGYELTDDVIRQLQHDGVPWAIATGGYGRNTTRPICVRTWTSSDCD